MFSPQKGQISLPAYFEDILRKVKMLEENEGLHIDTVHIDSLSEEDLWAFF